MKFSVMVNEGPYTHQAADTAYQFSRAVLDAGHEIFPFFSTTTVFTMVRG